MFAETLASMTVHRSTHYSVSVVVWVALAGCATTSEATHASKRPPSITVLDRGSEPRQRLRFERVANASERMVVQQKSRQKEDYTNTRLNTGHRGREFPTVRFTASIKVTSVSASGDAAMASDLEDAAILDDVSDPRIRKAAESDVQFVKGVHSTWTVAPNGGVSDVVFDAPNASRATQTALARFGDAVQESAVEFPDEPLGVGAAWRVESEHKYSGLKWNRTATYRVMALSESSVTLDEVVVMNSGEQTLSVEPNATTTVTFGRANATGQVVIPLRGLVATGTEQIFTEVNYRIVRGRSRNALTLQQETLTTVSPADATPAPPSPPAAEKQQSAPASSP